MTLLLLPDTVAASTGYHFLYHIVVGSVLRDIFLETARHNSSHSDILVIFSKTFFFRFFFPESNKLSPGTQAKSIGVMDTPKKKN